MERDIVAINCPSIWSEEKKGGEIYREHMVIALSRLTETAVACSYVCKSIFLCGKDDFTNIEAPPEGIRQSV